MVKWKTHNEISKILKTYVFYSIVLSFYITIFYARRFFWCTAYGMHTIRWGQSMFHSLRSLFSAHCYVYNVRAWTAFRISCCLFAVHFLLSQSEILCNIHAKCTFRHRVWGFLVCLCCGRNRFEQFSRFTCLLNGSDAE